MNILLIDNYDSFTYNLVHYFEALGASVKTVFNDQIVLSDIHQFDRIVISPGPGLPQNAGQMPEVIKKFVGKKPILGVCLGFQALYLHFGGSIINQNQVQHGVKVPCKVENHTRLFNGLPQHINVGLYHSWAADTQLIPENLQATAWSSNDILMAFQHKTLPIYGVQFHPESVLTQFGLEILKNFLEDS